MPSIYPYPLDLTGVAGSNRVVNEVHVINNATERAFVLQGGTFFTQGLQVKNSNGGALLQPHTQFVAAHLNREASGLTGLETCGVIFITDPAITGVTVTYQAVGERFCDLTPLALTLLSNMASGGIPVSWAQVVGEPEKYPPAPHRHRADTIYGLGEVVNVLEGIRQAVLIGHGPVIGAVYQYLGQVTANLRADFTERVNGIGLTSFQEQLNAMASTINNLQNTLNKCLPNVGDIKHSGIEMTAEQFSATQARGVWIVYGAGRVIIGAGATTDTRNESFNFGVGNFGGEYHHVQLPNEMANHKHSGNIYNKFVGKASEILDAAQAVNAGGGGFGITPASGDNIATTTEIQAVDISDDQWSWMTEQTVGNGDPMNITQPYIVARMFICDRL